MIKLTSTKKVSSDRFVALISGESGIGKTSLVKTMTGRGLIASAESGLMCLQGTDIPVFEIDPKAPFESICELFDYLDTDKSKSLYDYIFIDSLTEISQLILTQLKLDPKVIASKNGYDLWDKYKERMLLIIKSFRDFKPYSVVFTCLSAQEKDGLVFTDVFNINGSSIRDNIKSFFDISLHYKLYTDEDGKHHRKLVSDMSESILSKDRSGKLESYEEADLGAIMHKILGE